MSTIESTSPEDSSLAPLPVDATWAFGDVANGHTLTQSGWVPTETFRHDITKRVQKVWIYMGLGAIGVPFIAWWGIANLVSLRKARKALGVPRRWIKDAAPLVLVAAFWVVVGAVALLGVLATAGQTQAQREWNASTRTDQVSLCQTYKSDPEAVRIAATASKDAIPGVTWTDLKIVLDSSCPALTP